MVGESKAARAALDGAIAAWPDRPRHSDGIMGNAAHAGTASDHNTGDAFDLTVPDVTFGDELAKLILSDPRTKYVIFNGRIWNKTAPFRDTQWRPYTGANPHRGHVHGSIIASMRDDGSPWPWDPKAQGEGPDSAPSPCWE